MRQFYKTVDFLTPVLGRSGQGALACPFFLCGIVIPPGWALRRILGIQLDVLDRQITGPMVGRTGSRPDR